MADRVGQQLGNYRLIHLLGRGHFAEVYLGEHIHLKTQAAIKVLHEQVEGNDLEGFLNEARTIARLHHPHIVRVLDFGVEDGTPFLVMDYAPGGNLRKLHPKGTGLPLETVVSYIKQVAEALQYAHDQKLIHRDIKPENLLLGPDNEVLLSDFGLAIITQSSHYQNIHETAGSIAYMAPEQINGHPEPGSDQYALGIVVYEWLCGERPFSGLFTEVATKQTLVAPTPLHEKVPTIPSVVEHVVLKALAKAPEQRFTKVQDFALALEEASKAESSARTILVPPSEERSTEPRQTSLSNLPVQPTPLVGRKQEVATVCEFLRREDMRLVTLTGPGGIGKTRLGLQVAAELTDGFADGVFFVDLAPLSDPTLVVSTLAQTLSIREGRSQPLLERLKEELRRKELLLLFDNFEQVLSAAIQIADLLTACPKLKLVVTSREVLHVRSEREFAVPPLALPDTKHLHDLAALSQSEAMALFLQRAQAVKPDFQLTNANARVIAEICARLDGLPLAIELAAARMKLLSPQALLSRLSQRLQILTSGARDVPARQQTLRNTIEWSYHLLDAPEQQLFRRLSVFVGGCTLETAEAIYEAPGDETGKVFDGVASLIDKSLTQQRAQREEPRLVMLETIREYGLECLESAGETEATRQAHAAYYLALAEEAAPQLRGPQQAAWLERLEQEHDNLRAALGWFLERDAAGSSREMALRLGGALWEFWSVHGLFSEGRTELSRALAGSEGAAAPVRAKALSAAANLAYLQSDDDGAKALSQESLVLYREIGDTQGIATSLTLLAWLDRRKSSNFAAARSLIEESLALNREVGNKDAIAWSLIFLADNVSMQGEYSRGHALLEESLAMFRELGNKRGMANSLRQSAMWLFIAQGNQAIVRARLEESMTLFKELGDKDGMAFYYWISGWVALSQGDPATAHVLVEQSLALWREIGNRWYTALSLGMLGKIAVYRGDLLAARALHEESLAIARASQDKWLTAFCLEELAAVGTAEGETVWAARLWGVAEALRDTICSPLPPVLRADYERSVAAARTHLGEKAFTAAWTEGRMMTPEQALAAKGQTVIPAPTPPPPTPQASSPAPPAKSPTASPAGLTPREVEVLRLVARGLTDAQIAERLVITRRTVNWYLTTIYSKIQVSSRSAATRYALEHNLV